MPFARLCELLFGRMRAVVQFIDMLKIVGDRTRFLAQMDQYQGLIEILRKRGNEHRVATFF